MTRFDFMKLFRVAVIGYYIGFCTWFGVRYLQIQENKVTTPEVKVLMLNQIPGKPELD